MDSGDRRLCLSCIEGSSFTDWLKDHGHAGICDFDAAHGPSDNVVTVTEFATEVDRWFRNSYTSGETYPESEQCGETYESLIGDELGCNKELLDAVLEYLPDADHYDIMQGGDSFYNVWTNYELISEIEVREKEEEFERWYEERYTHQWEKFCWDVKFSNRFFSTQKPLDDLFGAPSEYNVGGIRPLYKLGIGTTIYRARHIDEHLIYDQLRENAAKALSAPPRHRATAGRMNVDFIPVFYAAFCAKTAVAELRPSIEDNLAVGTFELR